MGKLTDTLKELEEFFESGGVRYIRGFKKCKNPKLKKRTFYLPDRKEILLYVRGLGGKLFNYDKSIWINSKEKKFLEKNPKTKVIFNLAGFWFISAVVSIKVGKDGGYQCSVEYKQPVSFHENSEKKIQFVHLHNHFEYSQLDGCFESKKWIERCQELGFEALALTDHGTLGGIMDFFLNSKKTNGAVKAIFGYEAYITKDTEEKDRSQIFHLTLLAKNEVGWRNLLKLNTHAQENFYYRPRIDFNILKEHGKGLFILTGCPFSMMSYLLLNKRIKAAIDLYKFYCECVGEENVYLEIQMHEYKDEEAIKEQYTWHLMLKKLRKNLRSQGFKPKMVLTNDCHFILQKDSDIFFALAKINIKGQEREEEKKYSDIYLKTRKEMFETFKNMDSYKKGIFDINDFKIWCDNTVKIARNCNVELQIGKHNLPKYRYDKSKYSSPEEVFDKIIKNGVKNKLGKLWTRKEYRERLEMEANVIKKAGFVDYFLIIWDIIQAAKNNGIYVGAARGSVAGSLVAFTMDITDVDPIRFNLLFERFLNETRVSGERAKAADALPDIDVDFESAGREWVKKYIEKTYGEQNVCSLATYGRLQLRAAIKDIGRIVGGASYDYLNSVTRNIYGQNWEDLVEAIAKSETVQKFIEDFPDVMQIAGRCLGQVRHSSVHPAGVIISPSTRVTKNGKIKKAHLDDFIPIKFQKVKDEETGKDVRIKLTEWEGEYVERAGILKLDILGIRQLDIFKAVLNLIKKNKKIEIDLNKIPLEDDKVFERFRLGDTEGVFQFKSKNQKEYQKLLQPTEFEHLIAANSLIRPGAMVMNAHIDYVHIKNGDQEPEFDRGFEVVTKDTYGLYIYQEQIMQAMHIGGLSLAEADQVRTYIKKFDHEKMMQFHEKFVEGTMRIHKYSKKEAEYIWKKLEAFSGYGFNRSHSCSYALLGYWCNWLKVYYPEEFWCANLEYANEDDRMAYVNRILLSYKDIELVYPDINTSEVRFRLLDKEAIIWGLAHIKGVGAKGSLEIVKSRSGKKFKSLKDCYERVERRLVNKRVFEALIFSGCFDNLYGIKKTEPEKRREVLLDYYKIKKEKGVKLEYKEKEWYEEVFSNLLGISIFDWEKIMDKKNIVDYVTAEDFDSVAEGSIVSVAGVVTKVKDHLPKGKTEDSERMGFVTIKQNDSEYDFIVWSDFWWDNKEKFKMDKKIVFRGIKKYDNFRNKYCLQSCKQSKVWRIK